jgi:pimeloyl-ACP methyl ester carboxylesterase
MKLKKIVKITFFLAIVLIIIALIFSYAPSKTVAQLVPEYSYDNSAFITIQGMPVHYRKSGNGPALLLIHGTGASLHTWEKWTSILEKDFTIISLDMPGFGLTGPHPKADYSIDSYTAFLDAFVNKIQLHNFHLAGNSLGGNIAWNYAYKHPNKVNKLVLLDASGYPSFKESAMIFKVAKNKFFNKLLKYFTPKPLVKKSLKEVFYNPEFVTDTMVNRYYDLQCREGNRQAFIDRSLTPNLVDAKHIKSIKHESLILWGKEDVWISVEFAQQFYKDLPNSSLIVYDKVGHLPMEEVAEQSAEDTKQFLLLQ